MFKYLPLYYFYLTRLKNIRGIISYVFFPLLFIFLLVASLGSINYIFIINFIIFYSFYEIFYFFNDYESYDKEQNGVKRGVGKLNKKIFIIIRVICVLLSLFFIYHVYSVNINEYIALLVMTAIFFLIHNNIKEYFRFITFILLYICKYLFFAIGFIDGFNYLIYVGSVILIVLGSSLDYIKRKNNLNIYKPFLWLDLIVCFLGILVYIYTNNHWMLVYVLIIFGKILLKRY